MNIEGARVLIIEHNSVMRSMNTEKEYTLDALPDFFKPLRYIFEDTSFTSMSIQLEDALYIIRPRYEKESDEKNEH